MAPSSTSSCSPPQTRQYNSLRSKRAKLTHKDSSSGNPQDLSDEPVGTRSAGQSSKSKRYTTRDHSVNSRRSKKSSKTASIDDCLDDLIDIIKRYRKHNARRVTNGKEEMAQVVQILEQDGHRESDLVFAQALYLCTNRDNRRAFLGLETKKGRLNWVKVTLDFITTSK